jgi:MoaA/NifB/PqqE/SkfB family radical SAM enzyme
MKEHALSQRQAPYLGIRYQIRYHKCNLKCPYCIAHWNERENIFDLEKFRSIAGRIRELPRSVCLRIGVGGEIFTSAEILSVITDICNEGNNIFGVSFSSNLQADWEKVIRPFIESTDTGKLGMGCTLHDTVIGNVDPFFEKVRRLKESGVLLYVGCVAIPGRIEFIERYRERCRELGVPLILNAAIGKLTGVNNANPDLEYPRDYTPEEIKEFKKIWHTPHSYKLLLESCDTRGMECSAGKNYIYIDHDGNVFPCSSIKSGMGNIIREKIRFQDDDTICPVDRCWCGNENQALRIVDKYYERSRTLRIFSPREGLLPDNLYRGYNSSIFKRSVFDPGHHLKKFLSLFSPRR